MDNAVVTFTKIGDEWGVRIPFGTVKEPKKGDTVTVTKRSGETTEVTLGEPVPSNHNDAVKFLVERSANGAAEDEFRFRKVGSLWMVRAPVKSKAKTGDEVEVTKRNGTRTVVLGEKLELGGETLFTIEKREEG